MDIELLHTFLEVDQARHFGKAAVRLCVTQAAVSARIKLLETTLGTPLFIRNRNNIQLTQAGEQLRLHAETIVNAWHRVRRNIEHASASAGKTLFVGTPPDIAALFLPDWFAAVGAPGNGPVGFHSVTDHPPALLQMLDQRLLDLVVTTEAPDGTDVEAREIGDMALVLVSTSSTQSCADALASGYLYVDWGDWFRRLHDQHYAYDTPVHRSTDSALLAASLLLRGSGSAYLPRTILDTPPWNERLHLLPDAPVFTHPLYALLPPVDFRKPGVEQALERVTTLLQGIASKPR